MKTLFHASGAKRVVVLLACVLCSGWLHAQPPTFVLPSNPDNIIWGSGGPLNTAVVSYNGTSTGFVFAIVQLNSKIYVQDYGASVSITVPPVHMGGVPDVYIGYYSYGPGGMYVMAVACYDNAGSVWVDYYNLVNLGTPAFNAIYSNSVSVPVGSMPSGPITVHMDGAVATYPATNTSIYLLTYDDQNMLGSHVFMCGAQLWGVLSAPLDITASAGPGATGVRPDIAAITRTDPLFTYAIYGLITYLDGSDNLMYAEATFSLPPSPHVTLAPTTYDVPPLGGTIGTPRIDAIDDYTLNSSPTNANYMIVAQITDAFGNSNINAYSNLTSPSPIWPTTGPFDCTSGFPATVNHFSPVVALSASDYAVYHWSQDGSVAPPNNTNFMEPVGMNNPAALTPNNIYWVNSLSGTYVNAGITFPPDLWSISASAAVDRPMDPSGITLFAWAEAAPTLTKYKISSSGAYAFRPAATTAVQQVAENGWNVFPIPATTMLNITPGANYKDGSRYVVYDMNGRAVLSGDVIPVRTSIDVSKLAAAGYVIKMYNGTDELHTCNFVKN